MKVYVVESLGSSGMNQHGFATSYKVAEEKVEELKADGVDCWITEYKTDKNGYCAFEE